MVRTLAAALILTAMALPAQAQDGDVIASAANVSGTVQVNQGTQFLPLRAGQTLRPGDRVMAQRNGAATIRFRDGCDLQVDSETMVVVPEASTCRCATITARQGDVVASAADVAGQVQVGQGENLQPLSDGAPLHAGDRVVAPAQSSAVIKFEDGCDLNVGANTTVEVPKASRCACPLLVVQSIAPGSASAVGSTAGTAGGSAAAAGGVDWAGAALITGAVIAGDAILFNQDENQNQTVSP